MAKSSRKNKISFRSWNPEERACAVCLAPSHKGYMNVAAVRDHECLRKQCPAFRRIKSHPYWRDRYLKHLTRDATRKLTNENPNMRPGQIRDMVREMSISEKEILLGLPLSTPQEDPLENAAEPFDSQS